MPIITTQKLIDADKDADSLDDFVSGNGKEKVNTRRGKTYFTAPGVEQHLLDHGMKRGFSNIGELKAYRPTIMGSLAQDMETRKVWRWDGAAWNDTGASELDRANEFTENLISKHTQDLPQEDDVLVAITDKNNNKTWLQANNIDGGPTKQATQAIKEAVSINAEIKNDEDVEDLLFVMQDENGFLTQLCIRKKDGKFPDFVVDDFKQRMNLEEGIGLDAAKTTNKPSDFQILSSVARGVARHVGNTPLPKKIYTFVNSTGQNNTITFPDNYSDATPLILVICFEGMNDFTNLNIRAAYSEVSNHGVVWARSNFHGNSYGSSACMQDALEIYQKACEIAPIGGVILVGNSMGGIAALNALLTQTIQNVLGVYLTDPAFDLRNRYENGRSKEINVAYDCTPETYAEKTEGFDPALKHWSEFNGIPIRILATSNDKTVKMSDHTNKLYDYLHTHNYIDVTDTKSSGHNAAAQFQVSELLKFISKCASGTVITSI